jgi:hypothetical protein
VAGPLEVSALLLVGAAVVGVVLSGAGASSHLTRGLRAIALLSLFVGATLLIQASRRYFLGLGGVLTCGFVAILLATYSGLAINVSSRVLDPRTFEWRADRPAVFLSMLGFCSALLLVPSPWSSRRAFIQPMLVAAAVALPAVALLTLPHGADVNSMDITNLWVGHHDPALVLGIVSLALLAPVQIAGAVGWVYACTWGASEAKRILAAPTLQVVALITWTTWLMLGTVGTLPRALGGDLSFWHLLRHASVSVWLIAGCFTLASWVFGSRIKGILDRAEGSAAASTSLACFLGSIGLAPALAVLFISALLTFQAESSVAVVAVALIGAAFAVASPITWFVGTRRVRRSLVVIGSVVVGILVAGAAVAWPAAASTGAGLALFRGHGIGALARIADSNMLMLATLVLCPLAAAAGAMGYVLVSRRFLDYRGPWKGTAEFGYAMNVAPVGVWMLIGAALLASATIAHPLRNAVAHWPLPDPSEVAVLACGLTSALAVIRWIREDRVLLSDRHLTGMIALSAVAFIPFLVPSSFRSGGRLALAGDMVAMLAALAMVVKTAPPGEARRRRISWLLGAAALSVPLLAYTAVSAGYSHALVGATLADVGHDVGLSPFSHLRLLIVVPLTVGLMVADHELPRPRDEAVPASRWKDFEADTLVQAAGDGYLRDLLSAPLPRYLTALSPHARRLVALTIAQALAARYRVRHSIPAAAQASRADLNAALAVARRAAAGEVDECEIAGARAIAERIGASAALASGTAGDVRRCLASALRIVLGADRSAVEQLVGAMQVVIEATARPYLARQSADAETRERAMIHYRHELRRIIESWPGTFTVFQDPSLVDALGLAITPSFVLDKERRRLGLVQPLERPYAYVAALIAGIAAMSVLVYFIAVVEFRLGPHLVTIRSR